MRSRIQFASARSVLGAVAILSLGIGGSSAAPGTDLPDPIQGQELAKRICSNCHLVSAEQSKAVADVPSFKEIANRPGQTAGAIMGKIVIPNHPMPVIPITKSELKDLAAYIMSLREETD